MAVFALTVHELESLQHVAEWVAVTRVECRERVLDDALVFAGEAFGDQFLELRQIKIKHLRDEAERINVFPLVLGCAADGFHRQTGNRDAEVMIILLPFGLRLDVVGIE